MHERSEEKVVLGVGGRFVRPFQHDKVRYRKLFNKENE